MRSYGQFKSQSWRFLFLYLFALQDQSQGRIITVGILTYDSPDTYAITSMEATGSAMNIAISDFQGQGWLKEHTFRVLWYNGKCNPKVGVAGIVQAVLDEAMEAVIGPACSAVVIPTCYLLSYWNLPIFPHASPDPELADKDYYNTLIRVTGAFGPMAQGMISFFARFGWKRAVTINAEDGAMCQYGARALYEAFNERKEDGYTIAEWIRTEKTMKEADLDRYVTRIQQSGRIVFYCFSDAESVRFVNKIHDRGMNNGDYVFFYYTLLPSEKVIRPWDFISGISASERIRMKKKYYSFKSITMADLSGPEVEEFYDQIPKRNLEAPWYSNTSLIKGWRGSIISLFLYDATYLYLTLLNESIAEGKDPRNGTLMFQKSRNRTFVGKSGKVVLNDKADRVPDFWIWTYDPSTTHYTEWMEMVMSKPEKDRVTELNMGTWQTADGKAPPDVPECGFLGELCPVDSSSRDSAIVGATLGVIGFAVICGLFYYIIRRQKMESELQQMLWRVHWVDINFKKRVGSGSGLGSNKSLSKSEAVHSEAGSDEGKTQVFTEIALYKGTTVAVKRVAMRSVTLTRTDLYELKTMREMNHENLNAFIGACIDIPNICYLFSYCSKGSIQDIIGNETMKLDWMFKSSLISDLVNGMAYLHKTSLLSHGNLTSSKCLIDSRWQLKVSGYGLAPFRKVSGMVTQSGEYERFRSLLWTAPELMRMQNKPEYGTQKGDVYAFAIILQELVYSALPFFLEEMSPKEVVLYVKEGQLPPFRPLLPKLEDDTDLAIVELMKMCWTESPSDRPDFADIQKKLKYINKGKKFNILDNMILKLERYANNLEEIVDQRTQELVEEKKKTDRLLYSMLPASVAENLKQGKTTEAEIFESVTVYFSDIVGFTSISSESTPMQVVDLLNDLYTLFDDIIDQHDVYKVETIGDAYMVASGLPERNGDRHAGEIANLALDLLSAVFTQFKIRHRPGVQLKLRIGLHSGPCAAGVVGQRMPRYCLFGDTVNMASRMESNGEGQKIHISQAAHDAIYKLNVYHMTRRGEMEIKGKGIQTTYWLTGKQNFTKKLPNVF